MLCLLESLGNKIKKLTAVATATNLKLL